MSESDKAVAFTEWLAKHSGQYKLNEVPFLQEIFRSGIKAAEKGKTK